jgi:hypothetical protein
MAGVRWESKYHVISKKQEKCATTSGVLWDIENQILHYEAKCDFGQPSAVKRKIDELLGSLILEQKDYTPA